MLYVCSFTSVLSNTLQPHGLEPMRLCWPRNSPGKKTRVGCHILFQGIFLTQGLNWRLLCLMHWVLDSLPLVPPGEATKMLKSNENFTSRDLYSLPVKIPLPCHRQESFS